MATVSFGADQRSATWGYIVSRIATTLQSMRRRERTALVPYLVAGDPNPMATVPCMHALVAAGADMIELGLPFSDPMAEGPVIQRGHERALSHGVGRRQVLEMIAAFREQDADTPLVLMGYANPMLRPGCSAFARSLRDAGADAALVVDMPLEEAGEMRAALRAHELDMILLVSPTTPAARARRIADASSGFVYCLSLKGVSGADHLAPERLREQLASLRAHSQLALGVGFGIKTAAAAAAVATLADLVIVGSVLVERVAELRDAAVGEIAAALGETLGEMRAACDGAAGAVGAVGAMDTVGAR